VNEDDYRPDPTGDVNQAAVAKGRAIGKGIMAAIAHFDANRPRTLQKRLGFSDLGACREKIRATITGAPETVWDESMLLEPPMAAFIGTVGGDAIESIIKSYLQENAGTQRQLHLELDDGIAIDGSSDILLYPTDSVNPFGLPDNCVIDLKGRSELATVRKEGAPLENLIQISGYMVACVQMGIMTPDATAHLCYWDRSGSEKTMHVVSLDFQTALGHLNTARRRLADVARVIDEGSTEEGRRSLMDEPTSYCMAIRCPFFSNCWDGYMPVDKEIADPRKADAARIVYEARQEIKAATARVDTAKLELKTVDEEGEPVFIEGKTTGHLVQWILKQGKYGITEQLNVTPLEKLPKGKKQPA
jgi:hypothetical protein